MAMTYTKLVGDKTVDGSIRNWTNWAETPAETILTEAQAYIYSRLRVREMSSVVRNLSIAPAASTLAFPSDYIALKQFGIERPWNCIIDLLDEEYFNQLRAVDENGDLFEATPSVCMVIGNPATAHFDAKADQQYYAFLLYYARPIDLALTSNETNWLTVRYPQLLRAVCNYFAFLHKKEPQQASKWESILGHLIDVANSEKDMEAQARRFEPYWRS